MICENIKNTKDYSIINKNFAKAFEFIENNDLKSFLPGRYDICGDEVFALVQEYITKNEEEKNWESHEKYIDIQLIIEGQEIMGYAPVSCLEIKEDLRPEKDMIFYKETLNGSNIKFTNGDYAIFFPEDGHKPGCNSIEPSKVKKVVVKIVCEKVG